MSKKSKRDAITRAEYHQLCGLLLLARRHTAALAELEGAALALLLETEADGSPVYTPGGSHTGEAIYADEVPDPDKLLRLLGLEIVDGA